MQVYTVQVCHFSRYVAQVSPRGVLYSCATSLGVLCRCVTSLGVLTGVPATAAAGVQLRGAV